MAPPIEIQKFYFELLKNLIIPLIELVELYLEQALERLEHLPRRIGGGITRIWC